MADFNKFLKKWNHKTDDRQKVQHGFIALSAVLTTAAAFTSLIDQNVGRFLLRGALVCGTLFLLNAVLWALIQTYLIEKKNK